MKRHARASSLLALGALLLLAACAKEPEPGGNLTDATVAAEARKLRLQPGQWQTTTRITAMSIPGMPAGATDAAVGTPTTTTNCITPAQAARPDANILSGTQDGNCSYQRFSMAGAKIDAAMTCRPAGVPGAMAMTLSGGYSPTAFDMGMDMKSDLPGGLAMTMKANVSGKRIGACTANQGEAQ